MFHLYYHSLDFLLQNFAHYNLVQNVQNINQLKLRSHFRLEFYNFIILSRINLNIKFKFIILFK